MCLSPYNQEGFCIKDSYTFMLPSGTAQIRVGDHLVKVIYGIPLSTSNNRIICVKSMVHYKCSLMNILYYVQIFPVGCVLETESSGWTSKQHLSSEPSYDAAARFMGLRPIFMVKREVHWQY